MCRIRFFSQSHLGRNVRIAFADRVFRELRNSPFVAETEPCSLSKRFSEFLGGKRPDKQPRRLSKRMADLLDTDFIVPSRTSDHFAPSQFLNGMQLKRAYLSKKQKVQPKRAFSEFLGGKRSAGKKPPAENTFSEFLGGK